MDQRSDAQRYYDALKVIARSYQTVDQLKRGADKVGLSPAEHVECAYENLQGVAQDAIRGKRRPK